MIAANYTEFRTQLKKYLDEVEENNETLVVKRKSGKGTVTISLDEYNSIMETVHLLSSKKECRPLVRIHSANKRRKHCRQRNN